MQEKRKIRKETNATDNIENKALLIKRRQDIEALIKKKINENEEEKITEMTNKLSDKKNNNKELWKLKRMTQTKHSSAFTIRDDKSEDITNPEEIKSRVTEYYEDLYESNEVKEGYEDYNESQNKFIEQCLVTKDKCIQELIEIEIEEAIKDLEKGKAVGPDEISNEMIIEGGTSMRKSILRMMKIIYNKEEIPKEWNKAYIIYIYIKEKDQRKK